MQKLPKNIHSSFYIIFSFSNWPKCHQSVWATFVSKFVAKNLQKLPYLVTLLVTEYTLVTRSLSPALDKVAFDVVTNATNRP